MTQPIQTQPVQPAVNPEKQGMFKRGFEAVRSMPWVMGTEMAARNTGNVASNLGNIQLSRRQKIGLGIGLATVVSALGGPPANRLNGSEALAQKPKITIPNKGEISDNEFNRAILTCRNDSVIDSSPNLYWTNKLPAVRGKRVIAPSITSDQIRFQPDSNDPLWVNFFGGADKMNYNCDVWGGRDIILRAVIKNPKTGKWQRNSRDVYAIKDSSQELREKKVPVRLFKPIKCLPGKATQNWGFRIVTSGSFGNKPQVQDPEVYTTPKTGKSKELRLARQMPITTSQRKRILPC